MDKRKLTELLVEHKEKDVGDYTSSRVKPWPKPETWLVWRRYTLSLASGVSASPPLLRLIVRYLIQQESVQRENILYLNFEDDHFVELPCLL